jgi:2-polyprenyl-6-methoxyphenol hydroxylase-like FAD-dependent oxidoreductase
VWCSSGTLAGASRFWRARELPWPCAVPYALAEELRAAQEGEEDITAALARYAAKLKPPVEKRQKAGRRLARWFVPDDHARLLVRDAAMRMTTSSLASLLLRYRFAWGNTVKL